MNLKLELIRGISGMTGARLLNLALSFISSILLVRTLGSEGYGAYTFIISLSSMLALIAHVGLPALMTREVAKYEQANEWGLIRGLVEKSYKFVIIIALLLVLLMLMLSIIFANNSEFDRWHLLLFALPLIPTIALTNLRAAVLRGLRRIVWSIVPEMIIKPILFLLLLLILILIGNPTPEIVIIMQLGAALIALLVGSILFRKYTLEKFDDTIPEYKNHEWKLALLPFMGIACVSFFNVEFISIFLGFLDTNQELTIFRIATHIALIVALPLTLIESVISPHITRLYHAGELEKLQRLTQIVSLFSLLVSSIPAMIILVWGAEIITYLYGNDYTDAYDTLVVIVSGYMVVNLVGLSMQLLYATEYHASAFKISAYGAFITVLLCSILIPFWGALGAGIALGFGKALRASFFVVEARRRLGIRTSLVW